MTRFGSLSRALLAALLLMAAACETALAATAECERRAEALKMAVAVKFTEESRRLHLHAEQARQGLLARPSTLACLEGRQIIAVHERDRAEAKRLVDHCGSAVASDLYGRLTVFIENHRAIVAQSCAQAATER